MKILTFPESLRDKVTNEGFPYVSFTMARQGAPEFQQICLFIPAGMGSSDGMNYNQSDLGMFGMGAAQLAQGKNVNMADIASNVIKEVGKQIAPGLATAASLKSGLVVNPYMATTFEGATVRQFGFEFKLVPTSKEESLTAHQIENAFRKYMYPKERGAGSLEYPPTFRIKFMAGTGINKYMPRIIDSYLTAMTATYNSTGNSFHSNDGNLGAAPVEIDINLTFQEVRAITRDDLYNESGLTYKDGYESAGHVVGAPVDNEGDNPFLGIETTTNPEGGQ